MQYVRLDHDSQRQLLQMRKLRHDERLRIDRNQESGFRKQFWARGQKCRGHLQVAFKESGRRREDTDYLERVTSQRARSPTCPTLRTRMNDDPSKKYTFFVF